MLTSNNKYYNTFFQYETQGPSPPTKDDERNWIQLNGATLNGSIAKPFEKTNSKLKELPKVIISAKITPARKQRSNSFSTLMIEKDNEMVGKSRIIRSGVDCGDKICHLEHRAVSDCVVYLYSNDTNCNIPCNFDGCRSELHHYINCPFWICDPVFTNLTTTSSTTVTTTTFKPTTTPMIITTTRPPRPPKPIPFECTMSPLIYTSIVLNIFFFAMIFAVVVYKFRKTRMLNCWNRMYQRIDETDPVRQANNENEPLMNPLMNARSRFETDDCFENIPLGPTSSNPAPPEEESGGARANSPATLHTTEVQIHPEPESETESAHTGHENVFAKMKRKFL